MAKQDVTFELYYDGGWHALDNVLADPFDMVRGRTDELQDTPPQSVRITLHDPDQRFNPLNPTSDLYELVGPNTPLRISVGGTARWCGEVSSWVPRRTLDYDLPAVLAGGFSPAGKAWIEVQAHGVMRRLGQGAPPVLSAIRRTLTDSDPVAYWPLEDGVDAATAASGILGGPPLQIATGVIDFDTDSGPAGSAGYAHVVEAAAATITGPVAMADTGQWQFAFWAKGEGAEVGYDEIELIAVVTTSTDVPTWRITLSDSGGSVSGVVVVVEDPTGGNVDSLHAGPTTEPGLLDGQWHLFQLLVDQNGADADYELYVDGTSVGSSSATSVDAGVPLSVRLPVEPSQVETTNVGIDHIALWDTATLVPLADAGEGYAGEPAGIRIQGVAAEEGVTMTWSGDLTESAVMGVQTPDTTVGIWADAARTDLGILSELADEVGIHYRPLRDLYNQTPALTLAYDGGAIAAVDPVIDDQGRANDVEVRRPDGSSARATLETGGPVAVDRVGRMRSQSEANVNADGQLLGQAGWRLHLGTWPGLARYPQLTVDLDAAPDLVADVEALTFGDVIRITGLEHDPVDLLIQGWAEHVGTHRRTVTFNCTPAGPYAVAEVEHADYGIIGSDGSTLSSAFNAGGATSMSVAVAAGYPLWTTGTVDFDVMVAGARLHVTNISGASSPQTFTVDQTPVNGVVKTCASGSKVDVHPPAFIGM